MASFPIHPSPAFQGPPVSATPTGGIWGGGAGAERGGEMQALRLRPGDHRPLPSPVALAFPERQGAGRGEGAGPGRGSPRPSPRGTLGLLSPPLHCIPGSRREGRGGTGRRVWAGKPVGGVPVGSGRRRWWKRRGAGGCRWRWAPSREKKKKKGGSGRCAPAGGLSV